MCKRNVIRILTIGVVAIMSGCGGGDKKMVKTGFLSDYTKLTAVSDSSLRYLDKPALVGYSSFIVDKVDAHFQEGTEALESRFKGKLRDDEIADLTNYFHAALVKAIGDAGFGVVFQPGPGVARIRTAITDIAETNVVLAAVPQTRMLTGAGVGGASLEFEVVDSQTSRQIAAGVERKAGSRVPFTGLTEWGGAKAAMDAWAKRLKDRLKEAHAR